MEAASPNPVPVTCELGVKANIMRKLGLIGGLSWTSTARYYEIINKTVQRRLGGQHSAQLLIESLDFAAVASCVSDDDWDCAATQLMEAARRLERAGEAHC